MAVRAPHLYRSLRGFALGAFRLFVDEDVPFAFEQHESLGRPALYEYRPLVRTFIETRASALAKRDDARLALEELRREPAARIFARAHAGRRATEDDALFRTVVLPLLDLDRRRMRRLRLGRPRVRLGVRRARKIALRQGTRLRGRRAARRHLGRDARSTSATASASATPRPASSPRIGRRRRDCCRPTSAARPTASPSSSSSTACARASPRRPTRPARSPTP